MIEAIALSFLCGSVFTILISAIAISCYKFEINK
jgi:hypothetical protein